MEQGSANKNLVFLSSLPRSGSTLLGRILSQNQKIHVSPTSPLVDIIVANRNGWMELSEHIASRPDPRSLPNVLRGIASSYYQHITKPVIVDKSRAHPSHIDLWEMILGKKPKIIVTVRSIPDIIASLEKLHRATTLMWRPRYDREYQSQMMSIEGRAEVWMMPHNIIGSAYTRIREALFRYPECMHMIHYDRLTQRPDLVMKELYEFIGEEHYKHDFENVPTVNDEDDLINGYAGLHDTRPKVEHTNSRAEDILGSFLVRQYSKLNL